MTSQLKSFILCDVIFPMRLQGKWVTLWSERVKTYHFFMFFFLLLKYLTE